MASTPAEEGLLFGTKDSDSAFKKTLREMPLGGEITLEEPKGVLALPEDTDQPLALLAGGIGITPFRAMIRQALDEGTGHRITLFYSNRKPEEALFLEELQEWESGAETLEIVATMTRMHLSDRPWDGPTGRLNPDLIQTRLAAWKEALFILSGPPPMVDAMAAVLSELGVDPARIRPEKFAGYGP
jgi:ferredoxin-NADP reductase